MARRLEAAEARRDARGRPESEIRSYETRTEKRKGYKPSEKPSENRDAHDGLSRMGTYGFKALEYNSVIEVLRVSEQMRKMMSVSTSVIAKCLSDVKHAKCTAVAFVTY